MLAPASSPASNRLFLEYLSYLTLSIKSCKETTSNLASGLLASSSPHEEWNVVAPINIERNH